MGRFARHLAEGARIDQQAVTHAPVDIVSDSRSGLVNWVFWGVPLWANEALLKRIPADVIHSLMADLHLRIRKIDNRIMVITADRRD